MEKGDVTMRLSETTRATLATCSSIHQPHGFTTTSELRTFWDRHGPQGLLNIKEVTPRMVGEIRERVIEQR